MPFGKASKVIEFQNEQKMICPSFTERNTEKCKHDNIFFGCLAHPGQFSRTVDATRNAYWTAVMKSISVFFSIISIGKGGAGVFCVE